MNGPLRDHSFSPMAAPLRVVVTNPYAWPYVRRGSERLLNDLSCYLHAQGHSVSVFAMAPLEGSEVRDGVRYTLLRQRLGARPRQFNCLHDFAWRLTRSLRDVEADTVFCLNYFDAWAAIRARARYQKTWRVVFMAVGIPTARYFRMVPLDRWFMRCVLRQSDQVLALSSFARDMLASDFGVDAAVLPPPVMTAQFAASQNAASSAAPNILFVGDVDEQRKGARVLCLAFSAIRVCHPAAQLVFAGRASEPTRAALLALLAPSAHDAVEFHGVGQLADLPRLYQQASVTVLPAVWEAFGLVLVESLAAGTPVVGARHGGIPDIIDADTVGALFEPQLLDGQASNADGLAEAVLAVLARGKTLAVRSACQARAHSFSWSALGPLYEHMLQATEPVEQKR